MASNKDGVQVRRATSSDYDAVIHIISSFNGYPDYMPTLYQRFVETPTEYAPYVAELDDKVVSKMHGDRRLIVQVVTWHDAPFYILELTADLDFRLAMTAITREVIKHLM